MSGYDDDKDDWFAEPDAETEPVRQPQLPESEDDWFSDSPRRSRAPRRPSLGTVSRRRIAAAAGALVVLLLVLWAAGVFSSGSSNPESSTPTTTATVPTTTTRTTPTPAATPAPTKTLSPGDTGQDVRRLQRALTALGYSPGKADASYGPATKKALARFQKANGLKADGILGPKTLRVLKQKLAAR